MTGVQTCALPICVGIDFTVGSISNWQIFLGRFPTSPDAALLCVGVGGSAPNPKWLLNFPSIQVMVRGAVSGYDTSRAKAQEVMDTLLGLPSQDVGGDRWDSVVAISDIAFLGFDETVRPIWSLNFKLIIEPASGVNRLPL